MKKMILTMVLAVVAAGLSAQKQQGLVKTKGRMTQHGEMVKGVRLSEVTITVRGRNNVLSRKDGTFTLSVPDGKYYLQDVQKQGYVLFDPEVVNRQYTCSPDPLVLVMEKPGEQLKDKLIAERMIRRTLQRQLQEKEYLIDSLKEQNKLSEENYRKQLQEIYAMQESNEKLISKIAGRYSKIDFDELDDFNQHISKLILDGKLAEADSLINSKGDICSRRAILRQHQEANAQAEQELRKRLKELEDTKNTTKRELEDIAHDCYSKYEIFSIQHKVDSAAFYLLQRTTLDSTNVEWCLEYCDFLMEYFSDFSRALDMINMALQSALEKHGNMSKEVAMLYNCQGDAYIGMGKYEEALDSQTKALQILKGQGTKDEANTYCAVGTVHYYLDHYKEAIDYYQKGIVIAKQAFGEDSKLLVDTYFNLSQIYQAVDDYNTALSLNEEALKLSLRYYGEDHPETAAIYNNMGVIYKDSAVQTKDTLLYAKALDYYHHALKTRILYFGENHPYVGTVYNNISCLYSSCKQYDKALDYGLKDLAIAKKALGDSHPSVATTLCNIGIIYKYMKNFDEALKYYQEALSIRKKVFSEESVDVAMTYNNMGTLYYGWDKNQLALDYFKKAVDILIPIVGPDHRYVKITKGHIEQVNKEMAEGK